MSVDREAARRRLSCFMESWYRIDREYSRLLRKWDISFNTLWVLEFLVREPGGEEPAILADRVNMLRQTMTLTLDLLEKREFLYRQPHPTDRRRKIVKLTAAGKVFADEVLSAVSEIELSTMSTLSESEQEALVETSVKFEEALSNRISAVTEA